MVSKSLILTAIHWTKNVDPNSQQTGMTASAKLPAVLWNDLNEKWYLLWDNIMSLYKQTEGFPSTCKEVMWGDFRYGHPLLSLVLNRCVWSDTCCSHFLSGRNYECLLNRRLTGCAWESFGMCYRRNKVLAPARNQTLDYVAPLS